MAKLNQRKLNTIINCGDYSKILIIRNDGESLECLIDTEDVDKVCDMTWGSYYEKRMNSYYCISKQVINGKYINHRIHRLVMRCPDGMVVDHINHNTMDNRKNNLRIVTQKINLQNKKGAFKSSRTGVRGVCYHKASNKWYARVYKDRKEVFCKLYDDFEKACIEVEIARNQIYGLKIGGK